MSKYQCFFKLLLIGLFTVSTLQSFKLNKRSFPTSPVSSLFRIPLLLTTRSSSINGPPRTPISSLFMSEAGSENETNSSPLSNDVEENGNILSKKWKEFSDDTRDDIKTSVYSFAFAILVRLFLVEPRFIPSLSMFPTFDVGDQLLVDKVSHITRSYKRRDVVVFKPPQTYVELTGNTEALIKRIVAVGGDVVEVKNNHLYVNGQLQDENFINELPEYSIPSTEVPAGMLLVLGDNRNHSFDSHIWGFLPEKNVVGRAVIKYWPPWRVGYVEGSN